MGTYFVRYRTSSTRPLVVAMVIPLAASCVLAAPPESVRESVLNQSARVQQIAGALERSRRPAETIRAVSPFDDPPHQTWSEFQRDQQDESPAAALAPQPPQIHIVRPTQGHPWPGSLPFTSFPPSVSLRGPPRAGDIS